MQGHNLTEEQLHCPETLKKLTTYPELIRNHVSNHPAMEEGGKNSLTVQKHVASAAAWKLATLSGRSSMANEPSVGKSAVSTTMKHHGILI